jgi:hypothetical protein
MASSRTSSGASCSRTRPSRRKTFHELGTFTGRFVIPEVNGVPHDLGLIDGAESRYFGLLRHVTRTIGPSTRDRRRAATLRARAEEWKKLVLAHASSME